VATEVEAVILVWLERVVQPAQLTEIQFQVEAVEDLVKMAVLDIILVAVIQQLIFQVEQPAKH
jgi:hypothetical protein